MNEQPVHMIRVAFKKSAYQYGEVLACANRGGSFITISGGKTKPFLHTLSLRATKKETMGEGFFMN
jgi:hypothetical protein